MFIFTTGLLTMYHYFSGAVFVNINNNPNKGTPMKRTMLHLYTNNTVGDINYYTINYIISYQVGYINDVNTKLEPRHAGASEQPKQGEPLEQLAPGAMSSRGRAEQRKGEICHAHDGPRWIKQAIPSPRGEAHPGGGNQGGQP